MPWYAANTPLLTAFCGAGVASPANPVVTIAVPLAGSDDGEAAVCTAPVAGSDDGDNGMAAACTALGAGVGDGGAAACTAPGGGAGVGNGMTAVWAAAAALNKSINPSGNPWGKVCTALNWLGETVISDSGWMIEGVNAMVLAAIRLTPATQYPRTGPGPATPRRILPTAMNIREIRGDGNRYRGSGGVLRGNDGVAGSASIA